MPAHPNRLRQPSMPPYPAATRDVRDATRSSLLSIAAPGLTGPLGILRGPPRDPITGPRGAVSRHAAEKRFSAVTTRGPTGSRCRHLLLTSACPVASAAGAAGQDVDTCGALI